VKPPADFDLGIRKIGSASKKIDGRRARGRRPDLPARTKSRFPVELGEWLMNDGFRLGSKGGR
jgi:hypothetical protein